MIALPAAASADLAGVCPLQVRIDGDEEIVNELAQALSDRRIGDEEPGCGALVVRVTTVGSKIALRIDTSDGQRIERVAARADAAATMIESFARRDLLAPLLDRAPPKPKTKTKAAHERTTETAVDTNEPRPFTLAGGALFGVASDGSTWTGGEIHGCFTVSAVCVGGRVQVAFDRAWTGHSSVLATTRVALDVAATVDLPLQVGAVRLAPGVGFGLGTTRLFRDFESSEIEDDDSGPRLRAQLGLELPLVDEWSLHLRTAVDYLPFARATKFGSVVDDGPENVPMAGEPMVLGWLSIGVSVGGF